MNGPLRAGAAILAAGASSRMGRPKQLLPWRGTSVLGHLLTQWTRLEAAHVAAVCDPGNAPVLAELDRLGVSPENRIFNPQASLGMFSSVQCAARWPGWTAGLTHLVLVLGDQPQIHSKTLRQLLEFAALRPGCICQPSRAGRPRHPVCLPWEVAGALASSSATTLRQFLQGRLVDLLETDDSSLDLDLDTPADYQKALKAFLEE